MARESQGLQIALIVFVMFTIILGVTTFMFSKEYSKAKALADAADTAASEANAALSKAESENMSLKVVVGHAETATEQVVTEQFNTDMLTYAKNYNDADPNYRQVCQWLFDEVQRKNAALSAEKDRVQQVKDQNASLEKAKEKQIQQLTARAQAAETELAAERVKFNAAQAKSNGITQQQQQANAKILQDSKEVQAQADEEIKAKAKQIAGKDMLIDKYQEQIDELNPVAVESPDGAITYAGVPGVVQINLGQADGLTRLTKFSVYAKDTTNLTTVGRKGAIEVVALLGPHTAEARIVDDEDSDPMVRGDLVYTPLWKPGQRERFALTDGMDLNRDGRSDVDKVRNLITANGGDVDFWLDDEGKSYGNVTMATRYLVLGEQPTEGNTTERLNARKMAMGLADEYNLREITLEELLNRMGYVREVPVVHYGTQTNPEEFRAKAPEGVPRVSSGRVTDLFEKRNPPRPAINSAY